MFDNVLSAFKASPTFKVFPRIGYYVKTLERYKDFCTDRYFNSKGYEGMGVSLLENILSQSHIYSDLLVSSDDIFNLYATTINYIVPNLNHIIDPIQNRIVRKDDYFVKRLNNYKEEYFIPVSTKNIEKDYLFKSNWEFWSNVRCLRLMYNNTNALSFNIHTDKIIYNKNCPNINIFTIDIALLIVQYLVYLRTFDLNADTVDIAKYLHQYVVFPCLTNDPLHVWLVKIYKLILINNLDIDYTKIDVLNEYVNYGKLGSGFRAFQNDVSILCDNLKSGNITPQTFFNSLIMDEQNTSGLKWFNDLHHEVNIENLSQYNHVEFLTWLDWITLTFLIIAMSPMSHNNSYKTNIVKDINLLELKNFYNQPGMSTYTKNYIKTEFDKLKTLMSNI